MSAQGSACGGLLRGGGLVRGWGSGQGVRVWWSGGLLEVGVCWGWGSAGGVCSGGLSAWGDGVSAWWCLPGDGSLPRRVYPSMH